MISRFCDTLILVLIPVYCYGEIFIADCTIDKASGDPTVPIEGKLTLTYNDVENQIVVRGTITGFNATDNITDHGFHIHQNGELTDMCVDAGGHFNPTNKDHGGPTDAERHIGDLGNVKENSDGSVTVDIVDSVAQLDGINSVVGRAIVVHEKADDLVSQPTGDAGGRLGCCIISMDSSGNKANYSISSLITLLITFLFLR